ncbi:hypothetical protein [Cyclobacterium amurskyense]|uniref:hypothetical protein n=1 Tax=Cyclobacterium amurskyense TaxID=320787 RepID=UPI0030DB9ABB|tara:strand:- start:1996 stop:2682 length:687 start_codon:yes stop_codon:yes gene_type:complete
MKPLIHNIHINPILLNNIKIQLLGLSHYPTFKYPWIGLDEQIKETTANNFTLIGYGSLLNNYSSIKTLSNDITTLIPVIAFGVKRIYNYKAPNEIVNKYNSLDNPLCIGCLNTIFTNSINDAINGLTFELKAEEVDSLRDREKGYDLIPVVTINWKQPDDIIKICYVLSAPKEPRLNKIWVDSRILPIKKYEDLCLEGARSVSDEFLHFFHKTTYLADEKTLAVDLRI